MTTANFADIARYLKFFLFFYFLVIDSVFTGWPGFNKCPLRPSLGNLSRHLTGYRDIRLRFSTPWQARNTAVIRADSGRPTTMLLENPMTDGRVSLHITKSDSFCRLTQPRVT